MPRMIRIDVEVNFFPDGYKLSEYLETFEELIRQAKTTKDSNIILDGFDIVGAEFVTESYADGE